ncbi:MUS81 (predicted) [Pycnogonum litorale]
MEARKRYKRVKKVVQCPNPVFEKWLTEWRDEAIEKGWKTQHTYNKAIKSLKKYPLRLKSGREAKYLEFFGDKICKMIDQKIDKFGGQTDVAKMSRQLCGHSGDEKDSSDVDSVRNSSDCIADVMVRSPNSSPTAKKSRTKRFSISGYSPGPRTGAYALLLALYYNQKDGCSAMKKAELMEAAQPLCDVSFTVPLPGSYYTAWSNMGTLIKRLLVTKEGSPARYLLTDNGMDLAEALDRANKNLNTNDPQAPIADRLQSECDNGRKSATESKFTKIKKHSNAPTSSRCKHINARVNAGENSLLDRVMPPSNELSTGQPILPANKDNIIDITETDDCQSGVEFTEFCLISGSYDIILAVDVSETNGSVSNGNKNSKSALLSELRMNGVSFDVRKMHVGDFCWIAKEKVAPQSGHLRLPQARELILDYIVERKRMDDLASSIKDGRFHEQKFRLMNCNIRNVIYLVEDYGSNNVGLPETTLQQAITNTQIINGFKIRRVKDCKESVAYLTVITRYLIKMYQDKDLRSCHKSDVNDFTEVPARRLLNFSDFNSSSMKNKHMSVSSMFIRMLMKVSGLSADKAIAIVEQYPTPSHLLQAYKNLDSAKEKERLLCTIKAGKSRRNIGPVLSKIIYMLFCLSEWP